MDYKYIEQLLERYWSCETSLEEEDILRAFFSQDNIPADLMRYKPLFAYGAMQKQQETLGEEFDNKVMSVIETAKPVKARVITMPQRFSPLFKAAAIVAIILTLGNAMQLPFGTQNTDPMSNYDGYSMPKIDKGTSVALSDTTLADTMKQSMADPSAAIAHPIINR